MQNSIVDFLYALSPSQWESLQNISQFSGFSDQISKTASEIQKMQTFGVLNIADQPLSYIKTGSLDPYHRSSCNSASFLGYTDAQPEAYATGSDAEWQ